LNADDYGKQCGTIDAATEAKLGRSFMATLGLLMILLAISAGLYRMQSRSPAAGEQHHSNVVLYLSVIGRRVDAVFLHMAAASPCARNAIRHRTRKRNEPKSVSVRCR